jgi:hypothetical protein
MLLASVMSWKELQALQYIMLKQPAITQYTNMCAPLAYAYESRNGKHMVRMLMYFPTIFLLSRKWYFQALKG